MSRLKLQGFIFWCIFLPLLVLALISHWLFGWPF